MSVPHHIWFSSSLWAVLDGATPEVYCHSSTPETEENIIQWINVYFSFLKKLTINYFDSKLDPYVDMLLILLEQLNIFLFNQFQEFQC